MQMDRRDFLKTALVVSGGLAIGSVAGKSEAASYLDGIIYTKDNPGIWKGKEGGHAPIISVSGESDYRKVTVKTNHVMTEKHFIVRHTLVGADGKALGSKTFSSADKEAVSVYELPVGYKGKLYATSFCNQHDLWLSEANI
jgi:superoxide reductase